MNKDVGRLVHDQTRDYDNDPTTGSKTVRLENSGRDQDNQQRDGHKDEGVKAQACDCAY